MLIHQWVTILKQAAVATGRSAEDLGSLSYNSMRRFLPTMANILGYNDSTAQAIGSWQEIPHGVGTTGKSSQIMSLHYADEKALASGEAKRLVLHNFRFSKSHDLAAKTLTGEVDSIPQGGPTWEDLARLHRAQASTSASIPPAPPPCHQPDALALLPQSPPPPAPRLQG